ncbi:MAG: ABC transporter substrate-binding protein [Rhizobiaceae bacterium]|nr:ABC transporter substrate-binding protein [Rhizobiaceae bacterium]
MFVSRRALLGALSCAIFAPTIARAMSRLRIGILKFGTVNWELESLKHNGFDRLHNIEVEPAYFAGEDATNIAMLAGEIDMIVSDWLWVSRLRSERENLALIPYSTAVGAIMVRQDSPILSISDLKDRKIGVAGGPLDKSWLLIQALAQRDFNLDLAAANEVVYGAPPLLSEKARQGEFDAVLNFWHFCARLEASGFRRLVSANDAAIALGARGPVSSLGYVVRDEWARENETLLRNFMAASAQTKSLLATSNEEWVRLAPVVKAEGEELHALRDRYREGIPMRPVADDAADAAHLYEVLAQIGGEKLVGKAPHMAPGTYWSGLFE